MPFKGFTSPYYVNYWFANYPKASTVVDMVEGLRVSEAYRRQLSAFNKRKKSLLGQHSDKRAFQQWSKLLESTADNQEDVLYKASQIPGSDIDVSKVHHIDDVLRDLTTNDERFSNSAKGLQEVVNVANEILELCFGREKKSIFDAWTQECISRYAEDGANVDGYAENVVRSILSTHSNEFVRVKKGDGRWDKLTDANRRLGGLLASLQMLQSGMSDKALTIVRGSGATTLLTGDEIVRRIRESIRGSLQNYSKDAMEHISGMAVEKIGNWLIENIPGANLTTSYTGKTVNRVNYADIIYHMDPAFQRHISSINNRRMELNKRRATWDQKTSKADYTTVLTSTENDITLTTTIGFSVKSETNVKISSKGITKADIKLQDGTSLFTFLTRDLGLTSHQLNGFIRLAAGHGSNTKAGGGRAYSSSKLNSVWNKLINYVQAKSLLTALTGVSVVGQSDVLYFILNGKMFSIGDIIQGAADVATRGGDAVKLSSIGDGNEPGLKRSTYLNMNQWKSPKKPKARVAMKRSGEVFDNVVNKMYDTKIRVDLNTSAIQSILRTI